MRPLHPGARPGYAIEAKAWTYLRRGLSEWYMPWGNNVFTVDSSPTVRLFSGKSRSLEQLGAIVEGVMPSVRLLAEPENGRRRAAMHSLRLQLQVALALAALGMSLSAWALLQRVVGPKPVHR